MRTTRLRVVGREDVTFLHRQRRDGPDGRAHRAEVNGDVRRVGDELARCVEEGAAEVQAIPNVGALGRALEDRSHALGDGHQRVAHHRELDGRSRRYRPRITSSRRDKDEIIGASRGDETLLDDQGPGRLQHDGGAHQGLAHGQRLPPPQRHLE